MLKWVIRDSVANEKGEEEPKPAVLCDVDHELCVSLGLESCDFPSKEFACEELMSRDKNR